MGTEKRRAAPAGDTEGRVVRLPRRRLGRKRETLSITLCIFIGGPLAGLLYFLWESVLKGGKGGPASFSELADMLQQILVFGLYAGLIPCAIAGLAVKMLALRRNLPGILGMTAVGAAVWWQYGRLLDVFVHLGAASLSKRLPAWAPAPSLFFRFSCPSRKGRRGMKRRRQGGIGRTILQVAFDAFMDGRCPRLMCRQAT